MYIGIIARLLRVVRVRLLQLTRFLEHLERDLSAILTGVPTATESQREASEVDL